MNANKYDGYAWARAEYDKGRPPHELRVELLVAPDPLTEEELDWRQGAYRFIQEREEAGDE